MGRKQAFLPQDDESRSWRRHIGSPILGGGGGEGCLSEV